MLSFIIGLLTGLGIIVLLPLFIIAVTFDVLMFMLSFGWKALKIGFRVVATILGIIGLIITIPIFICILILL